VEGVRAGGKQFLCHPSCLPLCQRRRNGAVGEGEMRSVAVNEDGLSCGDEED